MFKNFKNLKIGQKLWVGFGVVLGLLGVSVIIALTILTIMSSQLKLYSEKTVPNNVYVAELQEGLVSIQQYMLTALIESDNAAIEESLNQSSKKATGVVETIELYKKNARVDITELDALEDNIMAMGQYRKQIADLLIQNNDTANAEAFIIYKESYKPLFEKMSNVINQFSDYQLQMADEQAATGARVQIIAYIVLLVAAALSVIISIFIIGVIRRAIVTPIIEVQEAAKKLAVGDLSAEVTYNSKDELGSTAIAVAELVNTQKVIIQDIGHLLGTMAGGDFSVVSEHRDKYVGEYFKILTSMREIKSNLSSTLREINEASEQVSSASNQVAASSQEMANGATDQASSVQELSATITELSDKVRLNAENAKEANGISMETRNETEQSNQYMQEMVRAMEEITTASKEIEKIINTISDIAEQTNLLSLNAAIEAARAGEAGKGFAVVAGEVGNLAQESAEAVKNTSELIAKTIEAVDNGTRIVDSTASSLNKVIEKTIQVGDKIQRISEASDEQAQSSEQLSQGVDQISMVVQTNAATAEECSATSEELNAQAQMLRDQIARFKLEEQ